MEIDKMDKFIKLTQVTNWKIENEKKKPTTTKTLYVRPQDIVSFCDDDGTTLVQFTDKGIHVKESAEEIYDTVWENKCSGAIVLMHDGYNNTLQALKRLLPDLYDAGYQAVTVSQMAKAQNTFPIYSKSLAMTL